MATEAQRQHLGKLMDELYRYRAQLDYPPDDIRRAADARTWTLTEQQAFHVLQDGGRLQFDCSEESACLLKWAGLWHWNYPEGGYTGTFLNAIREHYTDGKLAQLGALVVFGPGTGHHMAMVRKPDPTHGNPLLGSHGRPGFDWITLRDEAARQPPGITLLSITHL